jgi:glycosyltransferase 2 family protein
MKPTTRHGGPVAARHLLLGGGLVVSGFFLWLAVREVSGDELADALRRADLLWVAAIVPLFVVGFVCFAARWARIAKDIGPISTGEALNYLVAAAALSNTLPLRAGEPARAYWLSKHTGAPLSSGLGSVFADRTADTFVLTLAFAAVAPLVPQTEWVGRILYPSIALTVGLILVLACAWWLAHGRSHRARLRDITRRLPPRVRRVGGTLVRQGLASIRTPIDLLVVVSYSAFGWIAWALAAWAAARAVGLHLGTIDVVFVTAVINLGSAIPSSPGFIGTYQWLGVSAVAVVSDAAPAQALAFTVVLHLVSLLPVTIIGWIIVGRLGLRPRRRRHPTGAWGTYSGAETGGQEQPPAPVPSEDPTTKPVRRCQGRSI